jgi:O-antigen/teichoic acid export membrane protein
MTSLISKNELDKAKKLLISLTSLSLLIGLLFSLIMFFFSKELMILLYKNSLGANYVKYFAFPFLLYYIEAPLISAMTALNKTKKIMFYDTIVSLIRVSLLFILLKKIKMMAIPITTIISTSLLVILILFDIISFFRKHH